MIRLTFNISLLIVAIIVISAAPLQAQDIESKKAALLQDFLYNVKEKFNKADADFHLKQVEANGENILPEGEPIFLNIRLPKGVLLEGEIFGKIKNSEIVISLRDAVTVLNFPIDVFPEDRKATGWYIRENKPFKLDMTLEKVTTDHGIFDLSSNVFIENDDIFVPLKDFAQWVDFDIDVRISNQELYIEPSQPLPVQERMERQGRKKIVERKKNKPKLPLKKEPYKVIDSPFIDVSNEFSYERDGKDSESKRGFTSNITTVGDLLYGTFTTRTTYDQELGITGARANYKREANDDVLLGLFKARRYELGDVTTTALPLFNSAGQEMGVRITNRNPLQSITNPLTVISGAALPGWDVELFRENQFLEFQTVGEDGFFSFNNVALFNDENEFRLVFYGPQGELREENISIPVDTTRSSEDTGTYDFSMTFEDKRTYTKNPPEPNEDTSTPNISFLFERPSSSTSGLTFGYNSEQFEGTRNHVFIGGVSKLAGQTLFNLDAGIDDELESNIQISARRNLGSHNLSSTSSWLTKDFDLPEGGAQGAPGIFRQNFSAIGPFVFDIGDKTRYSTNLSYSRTTEDDKNLNATAGINTQWKGLTFNEQLSYLTASSLQQDQLSSLTTLSGNYGGNRIRTVIDYAIEPERTLDRIVTDVTRKVSDDLDLRAKVERRFDTRITEVSLGVDWQAGFARLSPLVSYDSEGGAFVGINSRFSIMREPKNNGIRFSDRFISSNGGASIFVYLDKNGNNVFDEGEDEPIEGAAVRAPQNGGVEVTDASGIAVFDTLAELKITDIFVDNLSLPDPLWISGFDGVSILPREGHITELAFPIHIAGEVDGTIYGRETDGSEETMRNVTVELFDREGKIYKTTVTDLGGFYFFSKIPPGTYFLTVKESNATQQSFARPIPQKIEIDYEGTLLYGTDIFVQKDQVDVPIAFSDSSLETDDQIILNFGAYSSRVLMAVRLFKIKQLARNLINDIELFSYEENDQNEDNRTLNIKAILKDANFKKAYQKCKDFLARDIYCKIEIQPSMLGQ